MWHTLCVVKITVSFDEAIVLSLRQLAQAQGRSQAELVRDAVMQYVRQANRPEPKGIGAYRSGRSGISGRAEELLKSATRERQWPK
jgi:metal-responsive CopG/Arc/MetJ family transcriptional regulator